MDSNRKIRKLYDKALNETDAEQSTAVNQPTLCNKSDEQIKRYYLKCLKDGNTRFITDVILNPVDGATDTVNVFIVYRIKSVSSSCRTLNENSLLFSNSYDNITYVDKTGSPKHCKILETLVSGTTNDHIAIKTSATTNIPDDEIDSFPGLDNTWIFLSIHWDVSSSPHADTSSLWCSNKNISKFTTRSSTG